MVGRSAARSPLGSATSATAAGRRSAGVGRAEPSAGPDDLLPIRVRRATIADTDPVAAFTRATWDGWDYLPDIWASWLAARDGAVFAAEAENGSEGWPIAIGRVALLSLDEAWMEGLRVDPAFRGRGVATAFQIAELTWAQAQGVATVRYTTGETNEASLQLGAKHGFTVAGRWRAIRPAGAEGSPGGDAKGRPAARRTTLARLGDAGLIAGPRDTGRWERICDDPTFRAGRLLYEWRAWAWQRLTPERLHNHLQRGELMVSHLDGGWALGLLARERLPGETRVVLLGGDAGAATSLVEGVTEAAGQRPIIRLPDGAPLLGELAPYLAENGWRVGEHALVLMERALRDDGDRPMALPDEGLDRVTFLEAPGALGLVPAIR